MSANLLSPLYSIPVQEERILIKSNGERENPQLSVKNIKRQIIYAHPVKNVSFHALWMNPMPKIDFEKSVKFQLENIGLIPRAEPTVWSYNTHVAPDSRLLTLTRILDERNLPNEYPSGDIIFTTTADIYEFPSNSVLLD